jgi:hypothetical protein
VWKKLNWTTSKAGKIHIIDHYVEGHFAFEIRVYIVISPLKNKTFKTIVQYNLYILLTLSIYFSNYVTLNVRPNFLKYNCFWLNKIDFFADNKKT